MVGWLCGGPQSGRTDDEGLPYSPCEGKQLSVLRQISHILRKDDIVTLATHRENHILALMYNDQVVASALFVMHLKFLEVGGLFN